MKNLSGLKVEIRFKSFLRIALCLFLFNVCNAQILVRENHRLKENRKNQIDGFIGSGYTTAIGLRGGMEAGISVKYFIKKKQALEGIYSTGWDYGGMRFTGLYEITKPIKGVKELKWFFGLGGHIGNYSSRYFGYVSYGIGYCIRNNDFDGMRAQTRYTTAGFDGILGLEYQLLQIPLALSLDVKPFLDVINRGEHFFDCAFTIRYVF